MTPRTWGLLVTIALVVAGFASPVLLPMPAWAAWLLIVALGGIGILLGDMLADAIAPPSDDSDD